MHHSSISLNGSFQLANGVPSPTVDASRVCLITGPKRGGRRGGWEELPIITYMERLRPKWVHFSGVRYMIVETYVERLGKFAISVYKKAQTG